MPHTAARLFAGDEELGKRDDDYRLPTAQHQRHPQRQWQSLWQVRWRRRRILMGIAGVLFIWLFVHNIPTDLGSIDERMGRPLRPGHSVSGVEFGYRPGQPQPKQQQQQQGHPSGQRKRPEIRAPMGPPPRAKAGSAADSDLSPEEEHYYEGAIKYYKLASTLHAIAYTQGHKPINRNVLFAASSLRSAANLVPMACEMAQFDRNYVHFALLGRESLPIDQVLEINGVDRETCNVDFHDGRPDYSEYSTDRRAEIAVAGAMGYVNNFMHPQVIITDDSAVEDAFFVRGIRAKAKEIGKPAIELPKDKYEDLLWMTRLDARSLAAWHKPNVNILIHAQPHSSGSLVRLLHSLQRADYAGLTPPQIIVDLPADIDRFARDYIGDMEWPPHSDPLLPHQPGIKLHHRLSTAKATTESSTFRFLESFYPTNPDSSHVLLLSAQAELSPLYYHYLMFNLLNYRHSAVGPQSNLFGLSLASPTTYLNGSAPFVAPTVSDMHMSRYSGGAGDLTLSDEDEQSTAPFLWQAPNADATLIFGDKWAELHDYLKNRFRAMRDPADVYQAPQKKPKEVAETQPGWMEYMLELMRARGWTTMFPALRDERTWVTIHEDLYQVPEEFQTAHARTPSHDNPDGDGTDAPEASRPSAAAAEDEDPEPFFLLASDSPTPLPPKQEQRTTTPASLPLHLTLPFSALLPSLPDLPSLSFTGALTPTFQLLDTTTLFKQVLRQEAGGCTSAIAARKRSPSSAGATDDLFCFRGQDLDGDADAEDVGVGSPRERLAALPARLVGHGAADNWEPPGEEEEEDEREDGNEEDEDEDEQEEERAAGLGRAYKPSPSPSVPARGAKALGDDGVLGAKAASAPSPSPQQQQQQQQQQQGQKKKQKQEKQLDSAAKQKLAHMHPESDAGEGNGVDGSELRPEEAKKTGTMKAVVEDLGAPSTEADVATGTAAAAAAAAKTGDADAEMNN